MTASNFQPLLEIDLTAGTVGVAPIAEDVRAEWVGGTGLGMFLLSQEITPGMKATDPECPVFIIGGPLTGTVIPSSSDIGLTTLNPDTEHHVCNPHAHGFFGSRLRQAGLDGLILRGKAEQPVYLWVQDGAAELRLAGDLWGEDTFETVRRLRALGNGAEVSVATIGPAGENLVWGSSVRVDEFSGWNTGGAGVVWGAKNLKAIAVVGDAPVPVADEAKLTELAALMNEQRAASEAATPPWPFGRKFLEDRESNLVFDVRGASGLTAIPLVGELALIHGKNFTDTEIGQRFGRRLAKDMKVWKIEAEASWNCEVGCHHRTTCTTGPMAGASFTGFGGETLEEVGPNFGIEDPAVALMLCGVVDGYGMKAASVPHIIAMLMEAFNKGDLSLEQTGGIDLTWGNYDGVLRMLEATVQRQGLGALIAQGFKTTATELGLEKYAMHMKWDGFQNYDQRAAPLFFFSSQVVSGAARSSSIDAELAFGVAIKPEIGITGALDPADLSYIPEVSFKSARWTMWENCAGQCHFIARHVDEPTHVEAVAAATGHEYSYEDALWLGERLVVLQRMIQVYLGFSPEEDFIVAQRLVEKVPDGPAKGIGFTPEELRKARDEFYGFAGFSIMDGSPSQDSLVRLKLDKLVVGA